MSIGLLLLLVSQISGIVCGATILLEAEAFDNPGGWVLDQQFMDQMGSPFLLAHGLGVPVADAATTTTVRYSGTYRVWVRTRNWVAPWGVSGPPGMFQVVINGTPLKTTFGTEGAEWHWQDGGIVQIAQGPTEIALHDLTGFEGRCDAIVLTDEMQAQPPNELESAAEWRRSLLGISEEPEEAGSYDLVVVGGGMAGMCASVQAARLGLDVALVQDRFVLAGNNSSEVRVWLNGNTNYEPYPRVGDIVREFEPAKRAHSGPGNVASLYEDDKRISMIQSEENISLFLGYRVNSAETQDHHILAVVGQNIKTGQRLRFAGRWFADCTGDGCVGYLAGADYDMTLDGHMGRSNLWNVVDTGAPSSFPRCPWAVDLSEKPFPSSLNKLGVWYWESGFYYDPFEKSEYIRDLNLRAMYGAWDSLKNVKKQYPNHKLNWAAYISGKRESRRLLGDVVLTEPNMVEGYEFEDGCVPTSWSIDLHLPNPSYWDGWGTDAFISRVEPHRSYTRPYWVPYRCFYSRNIDNLFMAGRDVSVTHKALGAVRVMRTGGMMGEIVGIAASLCKKHDTTPRDVYEVHLGEFMDMVARRVVIWWLDNIGDSLAMNATVLVSSYYDEDRYPKCNINDGRFDTSDNTQRWLSSASSMPDYIEFQVPESVHVSACRIVSGYNSNGGVDSAVQNFVLQHYTRNGWRDIEATRTTSNAQTDWTCRFEPVYGNRLRLVVTQAPGNISRIWEVALYHPTCDLDTDGSIDFRDVVLLSQQWLSEGPAMSADVDGNLHVDLVDFGQLSGFWVWP